MRTSYRVAGLAAALTAMAASAHHSGAMFDQTKTDTIVATVKEFKWASPHAWLYLMVPGSGGQATPYDVELSSINIIARKGWDKKIVSPGDRVTVTVHPMKDGSASGLLTTMKLTGGRVLTDHDY